jgi:hypothetical protein
MVMRAAMNHADTELMLDAKPTLTFRLVKH